MKYLPLGDSYTICTGAKAEESWPVILTKHLIENNVNCLLMDNPARNGFSTQNLIDTELPLVKKYNPDFVTLLIGVNDWVRGITKEQFEKNLNFILDDLQKNLIKQNNILLITIPDFGVTPRGKEYSNGRNISEGILAFNSILKKESSERGLPLVDIFPISKKMGEDGSLVAQDGLHPSNKEYSIWESFILQACLEMLQTKNKKSGS